MAFLHGMLCCGAILGEDLDRCAVGTPDGPQSLGLMVKELLDEQYLSS